MNRILCLAHLVLLDGFRRNALIGLVLFSLTAEISTFLFFDFIPRDIGRASVDFVFSIIWITGFLFILFHVIQVISLNDTTKALHTYLARPISRKEYVLGVFLGMFYLLCLLNFILATIGWFLLKGVAVEVTSTYFPSLSLYSYILSIFSVLLVETLVLVTAILFSSFVRGTFIVFLLTLSYYLICSGLPVVREMVDQRHSVDQGETVSEILKWLTAVFPDFSRFDYKNYVIFPEQLPGYSQIGTHFAVIVLYVVIMLWLASEIYNKRDLQ